MTQEAFQLYRRQFKNLLLVSQKEANEINKFLRVSWPRRAYAMRARYPCSNCGRVLTFYDLFETGREQHGDKFMRRILAGGEYNIQVAKNGERLEVHCTACKARNFLRMENGNGNGNGGPPPHSYCAEEYFYA